MGSFSQLECNVMSTSHTEKLAAACEDWLRCKVAEDAANKERLEIEGIIVSLTGHREEGAETHEAGPYKLTVTGRMTRTWDLEQLEQILPGIPEELWPVRTKREVDLNGIRWIEDNEPEVYRAITQALTVKPAKTSVVVKVVQQPPFQETA